MKIFTHENRRIVQHDDFHYDIEEARTDEDGNCVWAVIDCQWGEAPLRKEDEMEVSDIEKKLSNLFGIDPKSEPEQKALHTCALIESLGFEVSIERYERELKSAIEAWERKHGEDAANVRVLIAAAESTEAGKFTDVWCYEDETVDTGLFDDRPYRPATSDGDLPF